MSHDLTVTDNFCSSIDNITLQHVFTNTILSLVDMNDLLFATNRLIRDEISKDLMWPGHVLGLPMVDGKKFRKYNSLMTPNSIKATYQSDLQYITKP